MSFESELGTGSIQSPTINSSSGTRPKFFGEGSRYFGIVVLNLILSVVTLGLYYPWAKAAIRKFMWSNTEIKGDNLVFHGTGKEMFKGWIIVYGTFLITYAALIYASSMQATWVWIPLLIFYLAIFLLMPLAIFGAWRYRVSRTSWRGIFLSFDGKLSVFFKMFLGQLLLTIVTLGLYSPWMQVKIQKYLFEHTRFGEKRFGFHGEGGELFGITIAGVLLSLFTLYLYLPVYIKNRFNFTIDNTSLGETKQSFLRSTLESGEAFKIMFTNVLMLIFTLGLAFPWTTMRSMKMFLENIVIPDDVDLDALVQSADGYNNALGEEMADFFDIGFDF